jgi:hypothetical protein
MSMKLDKKLLHDGLDEGLTAAQIAERAGCSVGRVYQLMRSLGRSPQQVAAGRAEKPQTSIQCRSYDGYRVCGDGRVQSCWSVGGNPQETKFWRDLTISVYAGRLFVQLGGSASGRKRVGLRTIYRDAYGPIRQNRADDLYEAMRRKLIED